MVNLRAIRNGVFLVIVNLVVAVALLEGVFVGLLHSPRLLAASPGTVRRFMQQVYRHFNRSLIQFDLNCARYDSALTYTLKPGVCTFQNLEFRNEYRINHVGLRDDEADLDAPEIIVLGDSHAMGWGVDQDESLVRVLARRSGRKVLNAAISSYGTVRELALLDRLDTSNLKVLVIQYSDNDLPENRTFRQQAGGPLPITPESQYQTIVRHYANQRSYYQGKYVFRLFMKVLRLETPEPDQLRMDPVAPAEEAGLFLNAVMHASHVNLDDVQLIVFEVNERIRPARPFIAALDEVRRREEFPPFVRRLRTLDITTVVTPQDFYTLDDHMKAHGHEVVGEALSKLVQAKP